MSSLAAARADNFYYPPEYRGEYGSLNKFRGSHPLGDRAKRIHEGILIIRFEMPYKAFCTKCNEVIAKGVRFNAEKRTVGSYFSTKILEFSMKCCFCDNVFKIRTDPKNCDYVPTAGLRRKVEEFSAEDAQTIELRSAEERARMEADPMLKLETVAEGLNRTQSRFRDLEALMNMQDEKHNSDNQFLLNQQARKRFREYKKEAIRREEEERRPKNFAIPLLAASGDDEMAASCVAFRSKSSRLQRTLKLSAVQHSSIFSSSRGGRQTGRRREEGRTEEGRTEGAGVQSSCRPSLRGDRISTKCRPGRNSGGDTPTSDKRSNSLGGVRSGGRHPSNSQEQASSPSCIKAIIPEERLIASRCHSALSLVVRPQPRPARARSKPAESAAERRTRLLSERARILLYNGA